MSESSVYERIGGADGVCRLVKRFYTLMDELPEAYTVRCLHPASLAGSEESLFKFLSGWFGGPPLFAQERGHPRLRMRHAPYAIDETVRSQWMLCMRMSLDEQVLDVGLRQSLDHAFEGMTHHLLNV